LKSLKPLGEVLAVGQEYPPTLHAAASGYPPAPGHPITMCDAATARACWPLRLQMMKASSSTAARPMTRSTRATGSCSSQIGMMSANYWSRAQSYSLTRGLQSGAAGMPVCRHGLRGEGKAAHRQGFQQRTTAPRIAFFSRVPIPKFFSMLWREGRCDEPVGASP
jgi:hypothetical protein